jgi:hypothetical protein
MIPRVLPRLTSRLFSVSTKMSSMTPLEDAMRDKVGPLHYSTSIDRANIVPAEQIAHAFTPSSLVIRNDSHRHAHHAAMEGSTSKETHFQFVQPPILDASDSNSSQRDNRLRRLRV